MEYIEKWNGNIENTRLEYNSTEITLTNNEETVCESKDYLTLEDQENRELIKADWADCQLSAAVGFVVGMIDVFWVKEFSLLEAQDWGRNQTNKFVISIAKWKGCKSADLEASIRFLEKKYPLPADKLTADFGGGLQHHLRDFSHHASLFGLICSIATQFTKKGYGVDINGVVITPDLPQNVSLEEGIYRKIFYGTVNWFFHLVSDMAGSSSSPGKGTGIPGPILSLVHEVYRIPIVNKMVSKGNSEQAKEISVKISKLFNGTALPHSDKSDIVRFDLRTELGISTYAAKEAVPVLMNNAIIRAIYSIRRFGMILNEDCNAFEMDLFVPMKNKCLNRMMTISSGVFVLTDVSGATIKSVAKGNKTPGTILIGTVLQINFIGIANFAMSIKRDLGNTKGQAKIEQQNDKSNVIEGIDDCIIDIRTELDYRDLYEDVFEIVLRDVEFRRGGMKRLREEGYQFPHKIFDIRDSTFEEFYGLINNSEYMACRGLNWLARLMMERRGDDVLVEECGRMGEVWWLARNEIYLGKLQKVYYIFSDEFYGPKEHELERVCSYVPEEYYEDIYFNIVICMNFEKDRYHTAREMLRKTENRYRTEFKNIHNIRYETYQEFFTRLFGETEYIIFQKYLKNYEKVIFDQIGFSIVKKPTEYNIGKFRQRVLNELKNYNYSEIIRINDSEKKVILHNYIDEDRVLAMIGDSDFAESFISSEWNYQINELTENLDLTGVVAGYFKSIEQLMATIAYCYQDQGMMIHTKGGFEREFTSDYTKDIDLTLWSLQQFFKNNIGILMTGESKEYTDRIIDEWRKRQRNGYFHKDNLNNISKIKEIRETAIVLYCLILGGCNIASDKYKFIGIDTLDNKEGIITYTTLKKWMSSVIKYNVPSNALELTFYLGRDQHMESMMQNGELIHKFEDIPGKWHISYQLKSGTVKDEHPQGNYLGKFEFHQSLNWETEYDPYKMIEVIEGMFERFAQEALLHPFDKELPPVRLESLIIDDEEEHVREKVYNIK